MSKRILLTGATDGLGLGLANYFARGGAELFIHGRDEEKLEKTAFEIERSASVVRPRTLRADLADLSQVRRMNQIIFAETSSLDVIVNNAGIGAGNPDNSIREVSADGFELRFAVNHLAGFLIVTELLPLLHASNSARVINVSSRGHSAIDFDDLMVEHPYSGVRAYGQSKMAQIMAAFEFARRINPFEVTFNCLHPATYMPTKMVMEYAGRSLSSIGDGVAAVSQLVDSEDLDKVTGQYFDGMKKSKALDQAYDTGACKLLWDISTKMSVPRKL